MCNPTESEIDAENSDVADNKHLTCSIPFSPDKIEDCIQILRDVFVAVDFDTKLWDSLFSSESMVAAGASRGRNSSSPTMPMFRLGENDRSHAINISSLASVLTFLEIDDSSVPPEYLAMEPASSGLEQFMFHHPHLHDCLLQVVTMTLLQITTQLHSHHLAQEARSIHEHVGMLNHAIQQLTEINRSQLPGQRQHFHQQLPLHRAVSASATCTTSSMQTFNKIRVPVGRTPTIRSSAKTSTKALPR